MRKQVIGAGLSQRGHTSYVVQNASTLGLQGFSLLFRIRRMYCKARDRPVLREANAKPGGCTNMYTISAAG